MRAIVRPLLLALALAAPFAVPQAISPVHAQEAARGIPQDLPVHPVPLTYTAHDRNLSFEVEIADTWERRGRGLMFRTEMPRNRGMLFVFDDTRPVNFWMQNTPLPLDLIFIGEDGVVIDVFPGEPFSTQSIGPDVPSRFVLEFNRGVANETGLAAGVRVNHPLIDAVAGTMPVDDAELPESPAPLELPEQVVE